MMIEMHVAGLGVDAQSGHPVLVLQDLAEQRVLPIWIGEVECISIGVALNEGVTDRPMTHDLLLNTINSLGYAIRHIEICEIVANTYHARIRLTPRIAYSLEEEERFIDARPSDAIALALRARVPILVSPQVVAEGSLPANLAREIEEKQAFRDFLKDVKASDFNSFHAH